ncbi:MAG: dynamin family protein [candidate division KSB1 bacterium]|nr:dynamin family protein [candidate division KSB1 bacterium]
MNTERIAQFQEQKQALAEAAASLRNLIPGETFAQTFNEILQNIAEERLQLVVLGQFKRGKTTLINALFGRAVLPADVIPVTAVITEIRYSSSLEAHVEFLNGGSQKVEIEDLAEYITESDNPNNVKGVAKVAVGIPADILKNGVVIVDTPGIGSVHAHNTRLTVEYLLHADAAVFVFSADPPLTELEQDFLKMVIPVVPQIIFVLSKSDYLDPEGLKKVVAFNQAVLCRLLGKDDIEISPLSALCGLQAKQMNDPEKLKQSGLEAFERKVNELLLQNRGRYIILANADRILRVCDEWKNLLAIDQKARTVSLEELNATLTKFSQYMERIKKNSVRLSYLLEEIKQRLLNDYDEQTHAFIRASAPKLQQKIESILISNRTVPRRRLFSEIKSLLIEAVIDEFEPYRVRIEKTIKEKFNEEIAYLNQEVSQIINDIYNYSAELFQISRIIQMRQDAWQYVSRFYYQTWEVEGSLEPFINAYLMILPRPMFESIVKKKMKKVLLRKLDQQWGRFRSDLFYGLSENNRRFLYEFEQILERTAQEISHLIKKHIELKTKDEFYLRETLREQEQQIEAVEAILQKVQAIREYWNQPS